MVGVCGVAVEVDPAINVRAAVGVFGTEGGEPVRKIIMLTETRSPNATPRAPNMTNGIFKVLRILASTTVLFKRYRG
jgi:hypothetical protein